MSGRVRKAWRVTPKWSDGGDIFHAPTASKARYRALLCWRDPYPDMKFAELRVQRETAYDIVLPFEHRLVTELSPIERRLIEHAYGSASRSPGYRNHYCTSPGDRNILRLVYELALFDGPHGRADEYGEIRGWSGAFFYLTDLGQQVARSMLPDYPA